MKKIKEFFSKLLQNNTGESIIIEEPRFKKSFSEALMNENIKKYNRLLEEIESLRRQIKLLIPEYAAASEEFIMFVSIPKERESAANEKEAEAKKKNPYLNDFMLRKNEFEEKTRRFKEVFDKIAELRKKEINKYFEARRIINDNSIVIGDIGKEKEIEITGPQESVVGINMSAGQNNAMSGARKENKRGSDDLQ